MPMLPSSITTQYNYFVIYIIVSHMFLNRSSFFFGYGVKLSSVSNCPRCQIVRFCMWCQIVRCQIVRCQIVRCQIVRGVKLSAVSNCPVSNCPRILHDVTPVCKQLSFSRVMIILSGLTLCTECLSTKMKSQCQSKKRKKVRNKGKHIKQKEVNLKRRHCQYQKNRDKR